MIDRSHFKYPHIDRVCNPSRKTFVEQYGLPGKPVVILDVMESWRAMNLWTIDYFKTQHGSVEVIVNRTNVPEDSLTLSMAEYMKYMESAAEEDPYYLRGIPIDGVFSGISDDYEVPEYLKSWHFRFPPDIRPNWTFFYIGPSNSNSRMHLETMMSSSWNAVISGRKYWLFYPPGQDELLYAGEVDAFNPELDRYPLFARAEAVCCIQNPGEIVFTPSGWWHQVINEESCISIAEYFINECNAKNVRKYITETRLPEGMRQVIRQYMPELFEGS